MVVNYFFVLNFSVRTTLSRPFNGEKVDITLRLTGSVSAADEWIKMKWMKMLNVVVLSKPQHCLTWLRAHGWCSFESVVKGEDSESNLWPAGACSSRFSRASFIILCQVWNRRPEGDLTMKMMPLRKRNFHLVRKRKSEGKSDGDNYMAIEV